MFDFFAPEFLRNPYPYYAEARLHHPVLQIPNGWVVARYKDAARVLSDWRTFSSARMPSQDLKNLLESHRDVDSPSLNVMDPPAHSRLRRPISTYFSGPDISRILPDIEITANRLIENMLQKPDADVVRDIGGPLAAMTTARILGLDPENYLLYKHWTEASLYYKDMRLTSSERSSIRKEFRQFFQDFWERIKKENSNSILHHLTDATEEEIVRFGMFLLIAGSESTGNFLGNAVITLLKHRETLASLAGNPAMIPNFIEAVFRYDSPVRTLARVSTRDVELSGVTIPEGCRVIALIGSANRDPEVFDQPDRLQIDVDNSRHLSFGGGPHYCPGDDLARTQMEIVLKKLIPLLAELPPTDLSSLEYRTSARAHGLKHLHLPFHCIGGGKRA